MWRQSVRGALRFYGVIGITIGVFIWATAAVLGLAIVFKTMPSLQGCHNGIGWQLFYFYLGVKMARVKTNAVFDDSAQERKHGASKHEIIKGLLVNLSNAKVVIYFSSVMSFVLVNITANAQILTALLIITVETFLLFLCDFHLVFTLLCQAFFIADTVAISTMPRA